MAEDLAAFAGKFAILKAFKVRVRGDVEPLGGCVVRQGLRQAGEVFASAFGGGGFELFPVKNGFMERG